MAQNITLLGASYSDVPSVLLPKTGGGTAQFDDTTIASNAASASDILSGKLAWVNGSLITGTGTGGGGSSGTITQDANGYLVVDPNSGGGGGGLEFEEGTYEPAEDIARPTISFTDTHTDPPSMVVFADATGTDTDAQSGYYFSFIDFTMFGGGIAWASSSTTYSYANWAYRTASSFSTGMQRCTTNQGEGTSSSSLYWATATAFKPYTNSDSRYWRAGRTYKWIAVWKPTT